MTTLAGSPANPSLVSALADLFPRAFVVERWRPHRPLKIGIDADLIATGIMTPAEVRPALRCYTSRRMYLVATAAAGFRYDLDGQPAGEMTPRAADWARRKLASMDTAAMAAAERRKVAPASSQVRFEKTHVRPSGGVHRLGLADLRKASAARRQVALIEEPTT
jgi:sRNA-binding protein